MGQTQAGVRATLVANRLLNAQVTAAWRALAVEADR